MVDGVIWGHEAVGSSPTIQIYCRYSVMVNTAASQAANASSILVTCLYKLNERVNI